VRAKGESNKQTVVWEIFTAVLGEPENSHEGHTLVCVCQRQTRSINEIHNASSRGNRTQLVSFPWEPARRIGVLKIPHKRLSRLNENRFRAIKDVRTARNMYTTYMYKYNACMYINILCIVYNKYVKYTIYMMYTHVPVYKCII